MTWFEDLGSIDYFGKFRSLRAVGWLEEGHSYPKGEVGPEFIERLCILLLDPWNPVLFLGSHACDLCPWEVPPNPEAQAEWERARQRPDFRPTSSDFQQARRAILGVRKRPQEIRVGTEEVPVGCTNLWVPGDGCVYVAPSLIAHYVLEHRYKPPEAFVDAVLRCPEMHSEEYLRARRDLSEDEFVEWLRGCREPRSQRYMEALRASGGPELVEWTPGWASMRSPPST